MFDVLANGVTGSPSYDPIKASGALYRATQLTFDVDATGDTASRSA